MSTPSNKPAESSEISENELIVAFIERVSLTDEESVAMHKITSEDEKRVESLRIIVRRMKSIMRDAEIAPMSLIRRYGGPVNAIFLLRQLEQRGEEPSTELLKRIEELGFKCVQNDLWILPPSKTPQTIDTHQELEKWVYENLTKSVYKEIQYVLSFVAIIDLKKTIAVRTGVRRKPIGSTIFSMMELDEIVPPEFVYLHMKSRNLGLEDLIRNGDVVVLASSFNDAEIFSALEEKRRDVAQRVAKAVKKDQASLEDITQIDEAVLASTLEGLVPHPDGVAHRLIVEAKYWDRLLKKQS